ncbi:MAG: zinc-binding protein [Anaerolineae bacterium]
MKSLRFPRYCHLCGRRLWGRGWVYQPETGNELPLVICTHCYRSVPRCDVCGMPMGPNSVSLPDGRHICPVCAQTAVTDPRVAQEYFAHTVAFIVGHLGLALRVGAEFTLVDAQHLQRLIAENSPLPVEPSGRVTGLFLRRGSRRVLAILSGLPRVLFMQTVAHEWAHAWSGENCPLLDDPLMQEGFAEWVAYKTLRAMAEEKAAGRMLQRDGIYGEGLRRVRQLEERYGLAGVLEFCVRGGFSAQGKR